MRLIATHSGNKKKNFFYSGYYRLKPIGVYLSMYDKSFHAFANLGAMRVRNSGKITKMVCEQIANTFYYNHKASVPHFSVQAINDGCFFSKK